MLFGVSDGGMASCLDARSGRVLWRERLEGDYRASVAATGDRVYFLNTTGLTTVVACADAFREIARNDLGGEETCASMAGADGRWFLRTTDHLYCIGGTGSMPAPVGGKKGALRP
jgi:outer membrane protein assembly factor BamB